MILNKQWKLYSPDDDTVCHLADKLGLSVLVATILANRGITCPDEAKRYLNPSLSHIHDPSLLPDVEKAFEIISDAIKTKKKILIFGDYDVDGITATAIMVRVFTILKANISYRLPVRTDGGYDINKEIVEQEHKNGCQVIITCDCGTKATEAVDRANELGITFIVTDHHTVGEKLPNAACIVNPTRSDSRYPFPSICGVTVAMKFCQYIVSRMGMNPKSIIDSYLDLASIGTIADVSPLHDENRAIVKFGLEKIPTSKKCALRALLSYCRKPEKITPTTISFSFAPRINAPGRIADAHLALELFLTKDARRASKIAIKLDDLNEKRKKIQNSMLNEALQMIYAGDYENKNILIIANMNWERGVIGIVAGKVAETFCKPTIILTREDTGENWRGSSRSFGDFNMMEALEHCDNYLARYGGHAGAAGLDVSDDNLAGFDAAINEYASKIFDGEIPEPCVDCDYILELDDLTVELAEEIEKMNPFGESNPEPLFITNNITVAKKALIANTHFKLFFDCNGREIQAMAFSKGELDDRIKVGDMVDVCYNLHINEWNGIKSPQMKIVDIRKSAV